MPAVSGDGQWVVGAVHGRSFKWSESTGLKLLPTVPHATGFAWATAVSYDGSVTAGFDDNGPVAREARRGPGPALQPAESMCTTLWGKSASPNLIGGPVVPWSVPRGLTADGTALVGDSWNTQSREEFVWTATGGTKELDGPPDSTPHVCGISPDGSVIFGWCDQPTSVETTDTSLMDDHARPTVSIGTLWMDGHSIRLDAFLKSLGTPNLDGWQLQAVVGSSVHGDVLVGQGVSPRNQRVSWIVTVRGASHRPG